MNQIEVKIMGQSYLLGSPEGGEALLQSAVAKVDVAMCRIRDAGKVKARDRIAVLAALNLAFDHAQEPGAIAPVASSPVVQTGNTPAADAQDDAQLAALIAKLDAALAGDGQLL
jgi:cell division protein ZapA